MSTFHDISVYFTAMKYLPPPITISLPYPTLLLHKLMPMGNPSLVTFVYKLDDSAMAESLHIQLLSNVIKSIY